LSRHVLDEMRDDIWMQAIDSFMKKWTII